MWATVLAREKEIKTQITGQLSQAIQGLNTKPDVQNHVMYCNVECHVML